MVIGVCTMLNRARQIAINTQPWMQRDLARHQTSAECKTTVRRAIPLATSVQPAKRRDQKARLLMCKLRRSYRELGQPIRMSDPDETETRNALNRVICDEHDGPMKARPGQRVK